MLTPEQFNSIDDTINNVNLKKIEEMTDEDRLEAARKALHTMREYQVLWQDHGSDRIHQAYDDVEGDWLKDFTIDKTEDEEGSKEFIRLWRSRPGVDVGEAE
jgi:hypothetical protein